MSLFLLVGGCGVNSITYETTYMYENRYTHVT